VLLSAVSSPPVRLLPGRRPLPHARGHLPLTPFSLERPTPRPRSFCRDFLFFCFARLRVCGQAALFFFFRARLVISLYFLMPTYTLPLTFDSVNRSSRFACDWWFGFFLFTFFSRRDPFSFCSKVKWVVCSIPLPPFRGFLKETL